MHEAGLARGVAKVLLERGLRVEQVRLTVRGGQHDPAEFQALLRQHLFEILPDQRPAIDALEIRRAPFAHLCVSCGDGFEATGVAEPCPRCGRESLPAIPEEQIDIEQVVVSSGANERGAE